MRHVSSISRLARAPLSFSATKEIEEGQLTIHSDRGTSMKSKMVVQLLADLGLTKSFSRPHVSDDNPYSESQFKTLKYHPGFPKRFGCQEDALAFCRSFFHWYNQEHRHSGIGMLTPASVHYGYAEEIHALRRVTLEAAYTAHPERFVNKPPAPPPLPTAAWINPPPPEKDGLEIHGIVEPKPPVPPGTTADGDARVAREEVEVVTSRRLFDVQRVFANRTPQEAL